MRNRQSAWRTAPANTQSADAAKPANVPVALAAAVLGTWLLLTSTSGHTQTPTSAQLDAQELRRTQEREAQLRAQQERVPDVLGPTTGSVQALRLPTTEAPCFQIRQLELRGYEGGRFGWVLDALAGPQGDDGPLRKCIGGAGIGLLQQRAQDALIQQGFVTTRILVQPQDLSGGSLIFTVLPGSLHQVRPTPAMPERTLRSALPMVEGDVLNLRDIEQALENFQRAPTTQVDIQIAPASTPDQSDLIITSKSSTPVRVSFSLDDSGSKSTGRYQASATLSWDNPLGLNDLFYISQGHDAQGGDPGPRGNQSNTLHYSLPWGYWAFGLTMTDSSYYQSITGQTTGYIYKGESGSTELKTLPIRFVANEEFRC